MESQLFLRYTDSGWKCELYKNAKHPCLIGRGNKESKILIVGGSPSATEDNEGHVFLGLPSSFLQKRLERLNMDRDCYMTNAVKCKLAKKDATPTQKQCCLPFTVKLIEEIKPKVILAMGKEAISQLLGISFAIDVLRGKAYYHPELKTYINFMDSIIDY